MEVNRRIAHLDMDAFFASVELTHYPELKGKAVVVGGMRVSPPSALPDGGYHFHRLKEYAGRGVVTTSTYEARLLGVFSGMGLMKSAKLAPEAFLLPAQFEAYRDFSRRFKAAVAQIAPAIEDRGIDEIFIDLSGFSEPSLELAKRLKAAVLEATGLTCSIGIAANKLLAKIASDLDKPDGITILEKEDLEKRIWALPAGKINGIGPRTFARLSALNLKTIGDLAFAKPESLIEHFGTHMGLWLHQSANGIDEKPLVTSRAPKSVSRELTFERDLHVRRDKEELSMRFTELCEKVASDLKRKGYLCRTVGIKLRFSDFHSVSREMSLGAGQGAIGDAAAIRRMAGQCLKSIPLTKSIRLLGVRCGNLTALDAVKQENKAGQQGELIF